MMAEPRECGLGVGLDVPRQIDRVQAVDADQEYPIRLRRRPAFPRKTRREWRRVESMLIASGDQRAAEHQRQDGESE
jgi:hypothetical protein